MAIIYNGTHLTYLQYGGNYSTALTKIQTASGVTLLEPLRVDRNPLIVSNGMLTLENSNVGYITTLYTMDGTPLTPPYTLNVYALNDFIGTITCVGNGVTNIDIQIPVLFTNGEYFNYCIRLELTDGQRVVAEYLKGSSNGLTYSFTYDASTLYNINTTRVVGGLDFGGKGILGMRVTPFFRISSDGQYCYFGQNNDLVTLI